MINGKKYYEDSIEIENLYQVDIFDKGDLMAVSMMKIRAVSQCDGSKVAKVTIPKYMHDEKTTYDSEISDELRNYIEKNKEKI